MERLKNNQRKQKKEISVYNFLYFYFKNFMFLFCETPISLQVCPEFKVIKILYEPHGSILSPEC